MSSSTQLSFSIRVSSGVKAVHLLGSWDNYAGQIPLSKDKNSSKNWKGTFKFSASTLQAGKRYWYYYIIDGYHVAHNPSEASTTEPTTGRELNILDVAGGKSSSKSSSTKASSKSSTSNSSSSSSSKTSRSGLKVEIPKGRPLSVSQIKSPKPLSPNATKNILNQDFSETVDELTYRLGAADLDSEDDFSDISSHSGASSPASSVSGYSTPGSDCSTCTCERYGITRKGDRVKLDCGGSQCGDDSDCSDFEEDEVYRTRRHGMVVA